MAVLLTFFFFLLLFLFVFFVFFFNFVFGSEIRWRVKEALAGRLTYDGGGKIDTALRANFDVINLVPPGPFYPKSLTGSAMKSAKSSSTSSSVLTRSKREQQQLQVKHFANATNGLTLTTTETVS